MIRNAAALWRQFVERTSAGFAAGPLRRAFTAVLSVIVFLFPFSLASLSTGILPTSLSWIASVSITLYAVLTLLSELRDGRAAGVLTRFALIAVLVYAAEWSGVNTGFPFGAYHYTGALGARIAGIPVAIVFAWYALVISSWRMSRVLLRAVRPALRRIGIALVAGTYMLVLDLVLEPVAAHIEGYWVWHGGAVPFANYASWFVLSAVTVLALDALHRPAVPANLAAEGGKLRTSLTVYLLQIALFAWIALLGGYVFEAANAGLFLFVTLLHRMRMHRYAEYSEQTA